MQHLLLARFLGLHIKKFVWKGFITLRLHQNCELIWSTHVCKQTDDRAWSKRLKPWTKVHPPTTLLKIKVLQKVLQAMPQKTGVCSICESLVVLKWSVLLWRCFTLVVLNLSLRFHVCVGMGQKQMARHFFKVCGKMVGITLNELNDLYKARTLKS